MKDKRTAGKLVASVLPDAEFRQVDIYLKGGLSADSEVKFIDGDVEGAPETLYAQIDGEHYENLFPVYMLQEFVQDVYEQDRSKTDEDLTKRVLHYRIYDA